VRIVNNLTQARNGALLSVFIIGLCIGLIVAERVYISRGGRVPKPRFLKTHHDSVQQQIKQAANVATSTGTGAGAVAANSLAYPDTSPPRNDLEELLRKVAPNKEVLVAVANKNVNWDGMLATFASGFKTAGIKNHLILALDQETKDWAEKNGYNAYLMKLEVHKVRGNMHRGGGRMNGPCPLFACTACCCKSWEGATHWGSYAQQQSAEAARMGSAVPQSTGLPCQCRALRQLITAFSTGCLCLVVPHACRLRQAQVTTTQCQP
jgi:hypothetical protein